MARYLCNAIRVSSTGSRMSLVPRAAAVYFENREPFLNRQVITMQQREKGGNENWYQRGYAKGCHFARNEADYDELAAVYRAGGIPPGWDLFRAEILNQHLKDKGFNFQAYAAGFARACVEFYQKI